MKLNFSLFSFVPFVYVKFEYPPSEMHEEFILFDFTLEVIFFTPDMDDYQHFKHILRDERVSHKHFGTI